MSAEHKRGVTWEFHSIIAWHLISIITHLDHEVVLLDNAIVGESTHGGDFLGGHVEVGRGRVRVLVLLSDLVDLRCSGTAV